MNRTWFAFLSLSIQTHGGIIHLLNVRFSVYTSEHWLTFAYLYKTIGRSNIANTSYTKLIPPHAAHLKTPVVKPCHCVLHGGAWRIMSLAGRLEKKRRTSVFLGLNLTRRRQSSTSLTHFYSSSDDLIGDHGIYVSAFSFFSHFSSFGRVIRLVSVTC